MAQQFPAPVAEAIRLLHRAGHEAFAVGGCVRDLLLGQEPHDWDITTSANPADIQAVFKEYRTIPTGVQHGTVTVLIDRMPLEITTYRVDGTYSDNRRPDAVRFAEHLSDDLSRRDFTINAMALSDNGTVIDEFGGRADLEQRLIRCVGDPGTRFAEDALRILRALRFAAVLDFTLDGPTAEAVHRSRERLQNVSAERMTAELVKLLCGPGVTDILISFDDVFRVILPELTIDETTARAVGRTVPVPVLRLAQLLRNTGDRAGKALDHLRLPAKTRETVEALVQHQDVPLAADRKTLTHLLNRFGPDLLRLLIALQDTDGSTGPIRTALDALLKERPAYRIRDLAVSGTDLMALGFDGPAVGRTLQDLLERVMDETLPNEKDVLLQAAGEKGPLHGPEKD